MCPWRDLHVNSESAWQGPQQLEIKGGEGGRGKEGGGREEGGAE